MRFDQCTNGNIFMHGWTKDSLDWRNPFSSPDGA